MLQAPVTRTGLASLAAFGILFAQVVGCNGDDNGQDVGWEDADGGIDAGDDGGQPDGGDEADDGGESDGGDRVGPQIKPTIPSMLSVQGKMAPGVSGGLESCVLPAMN